MIMDNHQLTENNIEQALDTLPLEAVPPQLLSNIMSQLEPRYAPEPFHLQRSDILSAAGAALVFMVVFILLFFRERVLPMGWISAETPIFDWFTPSTALSLAVMSIELLLTYTLYELYGDTL